MSAAPLNDNQMTVGLEIICTQNPEWGTWIVKEKYDEGMWNIRKSLGGATDSRVLFSGELKYWSRV